MVNMYPLCCCCFFIIVACRTMCLFCTRQNKSTLSDCVFSHYCRLLLLLNVKRRDCQHPLAKQLWLYCICRCSYYYLISVIFVRLYIGRKLLSLTHRLDTDSISNYLCKNLPSDIFLDDQVLQPQSAVVLQLVDTRPGAGSPG